MKLAILNHVACSGRLLVGAVVLCLEITPAAFAGEAEDQLNFATGLLIRKEYELSAEEFRDLLKQHPDFAQADMAWYRLGEALRLDGDRQGAQAAYTKAVTYAQFEKLPQAFYRLAQLTAEDDHVAAAEHYAVVAKRWPDHKLAEASAYWSAEERFRAEQFGPAAAAYRDVLDRFPQGDYATHALYSLGWAELRAQRHREAEEAFRSFLKQHPDHKLARECRLRLAETLKAVGGHLDEALAAYRDVAAGEGELATEAIIGAAWMLYEAGKFPEASAEFTRAAHALVGSPRGAACLFNGGNAAVECDDYKGAARLFGELVKTAPAHELAPEAEYWLGYSLLRLNDFSKAIEVLGRVRKTGKLGAREADALVVLGEAEASRGDHGAAASHFGELLTRFPKHADAPRAGYARMLALDAVGRTDEAERAGVALLKAYPAANEAPAVRFALGEYRFRAGKYAEAEAAFSAFLAGEATSDLEDDALYKLAWCAMNTQRHRLASDLFGQVAEKYSQGELAVESLHMAGRAAQAAGDSEAARKAYAACAAKHVGTEAGDRSEVALMAMDLERGQHQAVVKAADRFIATRATSALVEFAHLYRGEALLESGDLDAAMSAYNKAGSSEDGTGGDAAYGVAWVLRRQGRHKDAAAAFKKLAAAGGARAPESAFWACRSLEDSGLVDEAGAAYAAFRVAYPGSDSCHEAAYREAFCHLNADDAAGAGSRYADFLKAYPASTFVPNALYDMGWMARQVDDDASARRYFETLLAEHGASPLVPDVHFRLGELADRRQDHAAAAKHYEAVLKHADVPFADKALYRLGWCYDRLGKPEEGVTAFRRLAVEHVASPLAAESGYRVGRLLQKLSRHADAAQAFDAVPVGEFRERALFHGAECLRLSGSHTDAVSKYKGLVAAYPRSDLGVKVNLGLGHCYRELGAFKDSVDAYDAVVAATETVDAASAVMGVGYCHYARGAYRDAAKAFLKVDILYGYDELKPEALHMVASSWHKAGDQERAQKYRGQLMERYPESKYSQENP